MERYTPSQYIEQYSIDQYNSLKQKKHILTKDENFIHRMYEISINLSTNEISSFMLDIEKSKFNTLDEQYKNLLLDIMQNGKLRSNRTAQKAYSVFDRTLRINLKEGFPLLTTKFIHFKSVFEEMMLFLRGDTNTLHLEEKKVNIWKKNTRRKFLDDRGLHTLPEGDLGCGYPHQFRNFGGQHDLIPETHGLKGIDQVVRLIELAKNDPYSRRINISLWNPLQEQYMALPPCHFYCQFYLEPDTKEISCSYIMRSCDTFLGTPFNIAQYAFFTFLIAKLIGYTPKELIHHGMDVHLYENQIEAAKEQVNRKDFAHLPNLVFKKDFSTLDEMLALQYEDIVIENYEYHPSIKVEMVE